MNQDTHDRLNRVIASAEKISGIVESWRDENGDVQPEKCPAAGEPDDLELLAMDLDSACEDSLEVAEGVLSGKRDSTDLRLLLPWREELLGDMEFAALRNTQSASELKSLIESLFDAVLEVSEVLGDSVRGRSDFYVYVHKDKEGKVFYVGKGTGKRAWSKERHPLWQKYVADRLGGMYEVEIVKSHLTESEAESEESELMEQYPRQLVNWLQGGSDVKLSFDLENYTLTISGPSDGYDQSYFDALSKYHKMRDESRLAVARERGNERTDPDGAISRYREAIDRLVEYARAAPREPGLKGELLGPWMPLGVDIEPMDRLTLLLLRQKRFAELVKDVDSFFEKYPGSRDCAVGDRILKRREKARNQCRE